MRLSPRVTLNMITVRNYERVTARPVAAAVKQADQRCGYVAAPAEAQSD